MNTMQEWIAHLQNPLVLAGFGLFIFAALLRPLFMRSGKLTGKEAVPLLNKAVNFIFILAVLAIIGGFALSWKTKQNDEKAQVKLPEKQSVAENPHDGRQKETPEEKNEGSGISIKASGQGQISVGGDVINSKGNVEKNNAK